MEEEAKSKNTLAVEKEAMDKVERYSNLRFYHQATDLCGVREVRNIITEISMVIQEPGRTYSRYTIS